MSSFCCFEARYSIHAKLHVLTSLPPHSVLARAIPRPGSCSPTEALTAVRPPCPTEPATRLSAGLYLRSSARSGLDSSNTCVKTRCHHLQGPSFTCLLVFVSPSLLTLLLATIPLSQFHRFNMPTYFLRDSPCRRFSAPSFVRPLLSRFASFLHPTGEEERKRSYMSDTRRTPPSYLPIRLTTPSRPHLKVDCSSPRTDTPLLLPTA